MTTLNYIIWLTFTKNILIPKLAGNLRTSNVDSTLVSFLQTEQLSQNHSLMILVMS